VSLQEEETKTQMSTEGDHVRTQEEDAICKSRREDSGETSPVILDLRLSASRTVRK
jgi:hypothetical protein